jgi:hypothetical protein
VITIEPVSTPVRMVKKGKLVVASAETGEPLTEELVRGVRNEIRGKR